ncbi:MAG TPA: hypothetical protein VGC07_06095 [Granulicella sp.]
MADLNLYPTTRRSLAVPVVLAVLILAVIGAAVYHFIPKDTAELAVTKSATWQSHVVFKTDTILVGRDTAEDDLYVVATLRITDTLHIPIFLKDLTGTLTTADGQRLEASAVEKNDLPNLFTSFPQLKPLAGTPLLREITIQPGESAEGTVLLRFPATQEAWNKRKSAALTVSYYHQDPQTIPIP